jgi:uracil-DNA glycosylase
MFDEFIKKLKQEDELLNCINQYSDKTKYHEITTNNLKLYLNNIYKRAPKYIFIGEAPGYKGCRITGIPFTSEFILNKNYGNELFGTNNGYKIINKEKPYKENTATIVWQYFMNKEIIPFFWNIFPFHPHKINDYNSNRPPRDDEIIIGKKYLDELLNIFSNNIKIVSIGEISYKYFKNNNITSVLIRHPSHGGKNEFIGGMNNLK